MIPSWRSTYTAPDERRIMKRRENIVRAVLAAGLIAIPGVASGQTTTTTTVASTTTTSVQPTTTTTLAVTTTTTFPNPCTGQPCTAEPPAAVLSTGSAQITADRGSYCWREPVGGSTVCLALARAIDYTP